MSRFLIRKPINFDCDDIVVSMAADMLTIQQQFLEHGFYKENILLMSSWKNICLLGSFLTKYYSYPKRVEHGVDRAGVTEFEYEQEYSEELLRELEYSSQRDYDE